MTTKHLRLGAALERRQANRRRNNRRIGIRHLIALGGGALLTVGWVATLVHIGRQALGS